MIRMPSNVKLLTTRILPLLIFALFGLIIFPLTTEAHSDIPAEGNLAVGKTIKASSTRTKDTLPTRAVDSKDTTYWESNRSMNQWLYVDLKTETAIGKVVIFWMANSTNTYDVQVSNDRLIWKTVASATLDGNSNQLLEHKFNDVSARYVRVLAKTRLTGSEYGNAIRELGIYAPVPTPSTTVAASPSATPAPTDFVYVCGMSLCLNGQSFRIHGATTYGQLDNPDEVIALAKEAKLNTVELVEYETVWHDMESAMSEETWARNDRFIAKAKENGLKVVLHFSSYGHALARSGQKPTTADWNPFLTFVMNRTNTVTGIKYAEEPTIAKIQLFGEIAAPNYDDPMRGTTEETTAFFKRTLAQLKALDSKHIISTGGFSYINDQYSGIDWKTIVSDPNNAVCDVEVNSFGDRNVSVPNMAQHCGEIKKPWFLSAWSTCQGTKHFTDDSNHWETDEEMALHAEDMYHVVRNTSPAGIGSNFWNLGNSPARVDNCDIGHQYPLTFSTVQQNAPQP